MVRAVDHVGIITRDIEKSTNFYVNVLGMTAPEPVVEIPGRCLVQFLQAGPDKKFELVQLLNENSPSLKFLEDKEEFLAHLCLEVEDIHREFQRLVDAGAEPVDAEPWLSPHGYAAFIRFPQANDLMIELRQSC